MPRSTLRQAAFIARTEFRRSVRNAKPDSGYGLAALVLLALLYVGYGVGGGFIGYLFGQLLGADLPPFVAPAIGLSGTAGFAFIALMAFQRTAKQIGALDHGNAILTRVPVPAVVAGIVVAETARYLTFIALPVVGFMIGLIIGAGLVGVAVTILAVVLLITASAVAAGFAAGMAVRLLVARSPTLARHKTAIGVSTTLLTFGIYGFISAEPPTNVLLRLGRRTVLGWLGHPIAFAIPEVSGDPLTAAAGLVLPVGIFALAVPVSSWFARRRWFTTAVTPEPTSAPSRTPTVPGVAVLKDLSTVPTSAVAVASTQFRRARRAPFTVQYAIVPFFLLIYQIQYFAVTGSVSTTLPATLGLIIPWSAAAAFSLNPLGEQHRVLGHVLLGAAPTRNVVIGTALASWLVGLPALLIVPATAIVTGWAPLQLAILLIVTLTLLTAAPPMAAGIGVITPKFQPTSLGDQREAVLPSPWAFLGFTLLYGLVVLPIGLAYGLFVLPTMLDPDPFIIDLVTNLTGLSLRSLFHIGAGITIVAALIAGSFCAWFAVAMIDSYRRA